MKMARVFKLSIELFEPNSERPHYCIEATEQVRRAAPNRVLHFGLHDHPSQEDFDWVGQVVGAELEALMVRLVGVQLKLGS